MKILLKIGIGIIAFIAILLIVAAFVKKDYAVERQIVINKPKNVVFDYVKFLKNQENYSKWVMMDVNMKKEYTGTDGTVGFSSAWDSKNDNVGKGAQTIKSIIVGEKMETSLHFIRPFEGFANAIYTTKAISESETLLTWSFTSSMPYPMNIMQLFMNMDEMIGNDLDFGLKNLKTLLEK